MDDLDSSAQTLQNEMLRLKKLMEQFSQFPKQLAELANNAEHDPAARAQLENFHEAWNSGLSQNLEKLKASTIKLAQAKNAFQNSFLDPNFEQALTEKLVATIELPPSDKALPSNKPHQASKKKSKSRGFV